MKSLIKQIAITITVFVVLYLFASKLPTIPEEIRPNIITTIVLFGFIVILLIMMNWYLDKKNDFGYFFKVILKRGGDENAKGIEIIPKFKYLEWWAIICVVLVVFLIATLGTAFEYLCKNLWLTITLLAILVFLSIISNIMMAFSINHAEEPIRSVIKEPLDESNSTLKIHLDNLKNATENIDSYIQTTNVIMALWYLP